MQRAFSIFAGLVLAGLFLAFPPRGHAFLPHGGGSNGGGQSAAQIMYAAMVSGQWQKLTDANGGSFFSNLETEDCAHFDAHGSCPGYGWDLDGASGPGQNATIGVHWVLPLSTAGTGSAYSTGAINPSNGDVRFWGGGHDNGGDSAVYGLPTLNTMAAAINGGATTGGGTWSVKVKSAASECDAADYPGSCQSGILTGTFPYPGYHTGNCSQWFPAPSPSGVSGPGLDGVAMPLSMHSGPQFQNVPGTTKYLLSGFADFGSGNSCMGDVFVYDSAFDSGPASSAITGPLFVAAGSTGGAVNCTAAVGTTEAGYAQNTDGGPSATIAIDPSTGDVFAWGACTSSQGLMYYTNPTNSSIALNGKAAANISFSCPGAEYHPGIVIPDPITPTKYDFFSTVSTGATNANKFLLITDIDGSPTFICGTFQTGSRQSITGCNDYPGMAWDADDGVNLASGGDSNIFYITPGRNGSGTSDGTGWTVTQHNSTATGSPPSAQSGCVGNGGYPYVAYLGSIARGAVMVGMSTDVWATKL